MFCTLINGLNFVFITGCTFAALPKTTRAFSLVLGEDPQGKTFLYTYEKTVVIRDIENPAIADLYIEHSYPVAVAKYSPTRFYICSGDSSGKIRIWDTTNIEHLLKNEFQVLGGQVKDIAWDSESKRLAVAGEGKVEFAKCILADSGNTLGNLTGPVKAVNSVAFKPNRPYRIAMGCEDLTVQFFEGPPFKRTCEGNEHSNFVQAVKYSPNGDIFISGGKDGKALVYDGKTGDLIDSLVDPSVKGESKAHSGGIYAVDFNQDGSELLTVSGDNTAKIWNAASRQLVQEFLLPDMQVGCLWSGENIISVSLTGFINYLDRSTSQPWKIIKGHNKPIMTLALSEDKTHIYSGASDGQIFCWDVNTGLCDEIRGKGHSNQVQEIVVDEDVFVTIGMDDTIRYNSARSNEYSPDATKLPSLPKAVSVLRNRNELLAVVACIQHIVVVVDGNIMFQQQVKFEALSVDICKGGNTVAIGGSDRKIHIYNLFGNTLKEVTSFLCSENNKYDNAQDVLDLKYSPDGSHLAVVGSQRMTCLYKHEEPQLVLVKSYKKHTARIDTLAWSPDSRHFATGSLDQNIHVWSLEDFTKMSPSPLVIKNAHKMSQITGLAWVNNNILVSAARDPNIKQWEISFVH